MEDCKVGLTSEAKLDLWLNKSWSWGACYLPDYLAALLNFTPQLLVVQAVTKLFQAFLNVFTGASLPLIDSQCSNNTVKKQISNLLSSNAWVTFYPHSEISAYDFPKNPYLLLSHESAIYTVISASDDREFK